MLESILYVSRSKMDFSGGDDEVEAIVRLAQKKNQQLGVTGALIFTGAFFAQVIEGPRSALNQLMLRISNDPRHSDIQVIKTQETIDRRFDGWSMAYSGPSFYVNRHIKSLLIHRNNDGDGDARADRIISLMQEFTSTIRPAEALN